MTSPSTPRRRQRLRDKTPAQLLRYVRRKLAIYDTAIASGQPVPPSFSARFEPNARRRSLRSFLFDEATYKEEVMLGRVRELRRYETMLRGLIELFERRQEVQDNLGRVESLVRRAGQEIDAAAWS
ncbi:hypothetical protein VE01_01836 [Pseudogymnoascus verrucosus]|uniref:Uncharacterized protein n=1 Tax=Pseudogymnoascus verrucosus TaxID=342668 RepID=A0A1B8GW69_9PEZI|nr:uncharacterized protein VE01_01836 [Pseudogymnoascus verrucosus]OBU00092.1 hypothetical protein VE01_01836 [Pseudogymnoascus verrucosus]